MTVSCTLAQTSHTPNRLTPLSTSDRRRLRFRVAVFAVVDENSLFSSRQSTTGTIMVEGGHNVRPPRRKRIQNNDSGESVNSDYGQPHSNGVNGRSRNGSVPLRSRHMARRRKQSEARRKKSRLILALYIATLVGCLLVVLFKVWGAPSSSSASQSSSHIDSANSNRVNTGTGNSNNGDTGKGSDRIRNKIPDNNTPLTEEEEQNILHAAQDELNQFPISIGKDDNSSNPHWETIMHPGTEALKQFRGESFSIHKKKRATASELAGVLSGKKLRGNNAENSMNEKDSSGIEEGYMRVPKFWDPLSYKTIADERERRNGGAVSSDLPRDGVRRYLGNFGSRLMTPAEAKSIGSRVPNSKNNAEMLETIFVAIASYRDWQCSSTVESVFSRASHPERVRVAVVDQIRLGKDSPCSIPPGGACAENPDQVACKYQSQIDYFTVDAELSVGPVFARHLGHRLYRGEYFAMQSDAHVSFVIGWDDEIIEEWHTAKNEMAILSTYLSGTDGHINLKTGERTSKSRPIMCLSDFEGAGGLKHLRHGQQPEGVPTIHVPTLDPFWAAGFSFGRGHFVVNIPYDQHLPWVFQGEEISIGLRGFSYGYDFYSPALSVCYHFYGRKNVPMFWENTSTYSLSAIYGMNRLNAIIHMESPSINGETKEWMRTDEMKYGIGKVRALQQFFDIFGIHVEKQTVEKHLCRFVGRPMQKEFMPFLRTNEMGLDYDRITYRFVDQWKNEK